MAPYQGYEIGHNAPKMWPDKLVVKGLGRRQEEGGRECERGGLFPEKNIDLIISSSLPRAPVYFFPQRKKLSDTDRGEDAGWKRVKERERKRQIRG